jgi:Tfp pilus assembly PilM family ATPase
LARVVGLDVGARHVRLLEAEGGSRGLRVLRLGEREIALPAGADREDAIREAVEALFRDTRAPRDEVVLPWTADSCSIREIAVPFREPDQIRRVAKFEFESHLHSQDIDDVVLDYLPIGTGTDGSRLLCFAAPKAALGARLESLRKARVDPVAVDVDVASLAAAAAAAGILAEHPDCVLVDVGSRSTKIVLVREGRIRSARAFLGGAAEPAPADAPALADGAAPADAATAAGGGTAVAVVPEIGTSVLARAAREVSRTLAQAATGAAIPVALVSGRGALVPGALDSMAAALGMEVRPLDLLARVPHGIPADRAAETSAIIAGALGAAARGLGIGPAALDLRREGLAYARRFDQVKGLVSSALGLALVGMLLLLWSTKKEREVARVDFDRMTATLLATSGDVEKKYADALGPEQAKKLFAGSGDPLRTVPDARRRLQEMHNHLKNELGLSTDVPPILSSLETTRKVHDAIKAVRKDLDYCLVTSEEHSQKEVKVNVLLSVDTHVDVLKKAFEGIPGTDGPLFKSVEYTTVTRNKQGKYAVPFILLFERK